MAKLPPAACALNVNTSAMVTRLKKMTANKVTYLITLISLSATVIRADDCKYESFDLSPLKG